MDVTAREIDAIPRGNLRVPRGDFVAVWSAAERVSALNSERGTGDWYVVGVVVTCRWIAGTVVTSQVTGRREPARAPVSRRTASAHEELIEAECLAAERLAIRHPEGVEGRPGWIEAIVVTLNWAWRGSGVPPLDMSRAAAG